MANRTLNSRRVFLVVAVLLGLGILAGGFFAYRFHHRRTEFLAMRHDGLEAARRGDAARAVELLQTYLARYQVDGKDPEDVTALAEYARVCPLVEQKDHQELGQTVWALRYLLRVDPQRIETRRDLMDLYSLIGHHAEALDTADFIVKSRVGELAGQSPTELTVPGLTPTGTTTPATGQSAAAMLAQATELVLRFQQHPDAIKALGVRAKSLRSLHKYPESLHACNWWADAAPDQVEPALVRVELLQETGQSREMALALADKWVTASSTKADGALLHGHTNLAYGQVGAAQSALVKASEGNPGSREALTILASDLDVVGKPELARKIYVRLVSSDLANKDKFARLELIVRDWEMGHLGDVIQLTNELPTAFPPSYLLGLRATALIMLGKTSEAAVARQLLVKRSDDPEALAWAMIVQQSLDRQSHPQQIIQACKLGLDHNARDYYLRHFMAEAYSQLGEHEMASREWERVIGEDRSWALPAIRLSNALLEQGLTEQAVAAAAQAYARSPQSIDGGLAWAEAWTANVQAGHKSDAGQLQQLLDALEAAIPHDVRPITLKVAMFAAIDQLPQASNEIQKVLASADMIPEQYWLRLASVSQARHLGLEGKCLARCQQQHGLTPMLAYTKATALGDSKAGLASFDADSAAAQQMASTAPSTQSAARVPSKLSWDLARAQYLEFAKDPQALASWASISEKNSENSRVQQMLLSIPSVRNNKEVSGECLNRLGRLGGTEGSVWRLARARWLVTFAKFLDKDRHPTAEAVEARNLLNELARLSPNSIDIHALSGQAYDYEGKLPDAVNELRVAANLSPTNLQLRLHLARLLQETGDFEGAREQLTHISEGTLGAEQRYQMAALLATEGQLDRAIKVLDQDANNGQESKRASLLRAQLYQRHGDLAKAEAVINQLLIHPDADSVRLGAELMASQGKMAEAHAILEKFPKDGRPGDAELVRGEFVLRYETGDGPDKAIELYEAATKAAPQNPNAWRSLIAVNLLFNRPQQGQAAVAAGLKVVPTDAGLLEISQKPDMLAYAAHDPELRQLLFSYIMGVGTSSVATQTLDAIFAASKTKAQPAMARQALAIRLRELATANPRFEPLQLYLVNLYADPPLQQFDDAVTVASLAINASPYSEPILRAYTEVLIKAERWPEALTAAYRWRDNAPSNRVEATLVAADLLASHLSKPVDAIDLLRPWVDPSSPRFDPAVLKDGKVSRQYVEAQVRAGITPDLAALMQPLLTRATEKKLGRLQWMQFAVVNLPAAEADGWLQRAEGQMPPPTTPDAILERVGLSEMYSVLAQRSNESAYAKKAREILESLGKLENPDPKVLLALGTRQDNDKDWSAAVLSYQRVLTALPKEVKPDDLTLILTENNLAMAMARTGQAADAVKYIDAAIKAKPDTAELLDTRAFVHSKAAQLDLAVADIRKAITLVPDQPRFRVRLIQYLCDANRQHDAAIELKALDKLPFDPASLSPEDRQELKDFHIRLAGA